MANRRSAPNRKRNLADRTSWQPRGTNRRAGISGRVITALVLIAVLIGIIGYVLIFAPFLWINEVTVKGTKNLDAEKISQSADAAVESHFGPITSRSIFLINEAAVAAAIKRSNDDVAKVQVTKQWPNSLTADITERESTLLWQTKDKFYLVDQQGIAFEETQPKEGLVKVEDSTGLPVEVGKQIVSSSFIKELNDIQQEMKTAGFVVTGFRIPESTFEVQAVTNQGYYVLFDTTRSIPFQVDALKRAVQQGKPSQYADVRVPGRVYVR
ncbi:FtsQ-type POTRA domain-containing protein [Patescibacteria group bacterium]|nr:FtsQ-type POTRA domain-containing protein [Patescibacteria group bacterium]